MSWEKIWAKPVDIVKPTPKEIKAKEIQIDKDVKQNKENKKKALSFRSAWKIAQDIESYFVENGNTYDIPPVDEDRIISIAQSNKAEKFKKYLKKWIEQKQLTPQKLNYLLKLFDVKKDNTDKQKIVEKKTDIEKKIEENEKKIEEDEKKIQEKALEQKRANVEKAKRDINSYGQLDKFLKYNPQIASQFNSVLDWAKDGLSQLEKEDDINQIKNKIKKVRQSISSIKKLIRNRNNLKKIYKSLPKEEKAVFKSTLREVDRPAYRALVLLEGSKTPKNIEASKKILFGSSDLKRMRNKKRC